MNVRTNHEIVEFIKYIFPTAYAIRVNIGTSSQSVSFKSEYSIVTNFPRLVKMVLFFGTVNIDNSMFRDGSRGCPSCGDGAYYEVAFNIFPADAESDRLVNALKEAGYENNA